MERPSLRTKWTTKRLPISSLVRSGGVRCFWASTSPISCAPSWSSCRRSSSSILVVPFREIPGTFRSLTIDVGLLALGLAAYGAVFALVGALLRKPVVVGLVFAFGWEQAAMLMPGYLSRVTIAYYLQALVPHAIPSQEGVSALLQALIGKVPEPATCLTALVVATVVALVLGCRVVERREYVLEQ